jgi:phage terminase large subunit
LRTWDPAQLISLDSRMPLLSKLKKELSQPVWTKSGRLRMMVDKTPEGTTSPNLGDVCMMAYWPVPSDTHLLATSFSAPIMVHG